MKRLAILVAVGAFLFYTAPVLAKGATQIKDCSQVPHPYSYTDCSFDFWNGNGIMSKYSPISYHDVITPSGNENEMFTGVITNDTGMMLYIQHSAVRQFQQEQLVIVL